MVDQFHFQIPPDKFSSSNTLYIRTQSVYKMSIETKNYLLLIVVPVLHSTQINLIEKTFEKLSPSDAFTQSAPVTRVHVASHS
jgi:hypothetical protein